MTAESTIQGLAPLKDTQFVIDISLIIRYLNDIFNDTACLTGDLILLNLELLALEISPENSEHSQRGIQVAIRSIF